MQDLVCTTIIIFLNHNLFSNPLELAFIWNSKKSVSCHLTLSREPRAKWLTKHCVLLVNSDRELFQPLTSWRSPPLSSLFLEK